MIRTSPAPVLVAALLALDVSAVHAAGESEFVFDRCEHMMTRADATTPALGVSGKSWDVDMTCISHDGSIGRWHVNGSTDPGRVQSIQLQQLEDMGAAMPIPTTD